MKSIPLIISLCFAVIGTGINAQITIPNKNKLKPDIIDFPNPVFDWESPGYHITYPYLVGIGTSNPEAQLHVNHKGKGILLTRDGYTPYSFKQSASNGLSIVNESTNSISMYFSNNGYIGIGTTNVADANLHIKHKGRAIRFSRDGFTPFSIVQSGKDGLAIRNDVTHKNIIFLTPNGKVGIGSNNPDSKLTVKGIIHSEEVKVDLNIPGPDYVFEEDYNLWDLIELKEFLKQNKHLPEIPTAKEMKENGIMIGELNILLLKKVEELTLYIIQQEEKITELEKLDSKFEVIEKELIRVNELVNSKLKKS